MSSFQPLQSKRTLLSTPATPTSSLLRPSRPLVPTTPPASEPVAPPTQEQLERAARLGHSLERISLFPPERKNTTGMPDPLKTGIEKLSGLSLDDVHVHFNSSEPAQVQALPYTQGSEIHVGSGQERHLAHEAWHVVQQKQGRVMPTLQTKGVAINDDLGLEKEADMMGEKAEKDKRTRNSQPNGASNSEADQVAEQGRSTSTFLTVSLPIQRKVQGKFLEVPRGGEANWDYHYFKYPFRVRAEFQPYKDEDEGGLGEYRQLVKGYMKGNDEIIEHKLFGGKLLDPTTYNEDGLGEYRYGHREDEFGEYTDDDTAQPPKSVFQAKDEPTWGSPNDGVKVEYKLDFKGQLVDTVKENELIEEKTWEIEGGPRTTGRPRRPVYNLRQVSFERNVI